MTQRKFGYTYLGRYYSPDRSYHCPGLEKSLKVVFQHFGKEITDVFSFGCSVGINETILAADHLSTNILAVDSDENAIAVAKSGEWDLSDIRPSGISIPSSDQQVERLYHATCNPEYFELDFDQEKLKLLKETPNLEFRHVDNWGEGYLENSFNLVFFTKYLIHSGADQN